MTAKVNGLYQIPNSLAPYAPSMEEEPVGPPIVEGETYAYVGTIPKEACGHKYRVLRFILDVPSYQEKVLVEALTGRDRGIWFVCSPANFAQRYRRDSDAKNP